MCAEAAREGCAHEGARDQPTGDSRLEVAGGVSGCITWLGMFAAVKSWTDEFRSIGTGWEYTSGNRTCMGGERVKKTSGFVAYALALTVAFYLAAYYFLPPPAPSAAMVALFAAIAMAVVWVAEVVFRKKRGSGKHLLIPFLMLGLVTLVGCSPVTHTSSQKRAPPPAAPAPLPTAKPAPASPPDRAPSPAGDHRDGATAARGADHGGSMPRVTGTAILLPQHAEQLGYGLYSYALMSHRPEASELARYKAFVTALLEQPTAESVERSVPKSRINITYVPMDSSVPSWGGPPTDEEVTYIIDHFDYGRGAAMLASLSTRTGSGPVIVSVLRPLDMSQHPHPVLVQDMSLAQPSLMSAYVSSFVQQAAKDQFWQQSTLGSFALSLRNTLETAAMALSMSKDAVDGWVKYFK